MEIDNIRIKSGGTGANLSGKSSGFENVKNYIGDKLHFAAESLHGNDAGQNAETGVSKWLNQSAEYIRQFDYKQTDARIREYVGQKPLQSILIAGSVGLMVGIILRRR